MQRDQSHPRPTGILSLRILRNGELLREESGCNLVLDAFRGIEARLLGGDVANNVVTQIGFGTGVSAPLPGNTSLTDAYIKAIAAVTYPSSGQVRFEFSLGSGEANGKEIAEFGLLTAGGELYARKVRGAPLLKTADISLSGAWIINF